MSFSDDTLRRLLATAEKNMWPESLKDRASELLGYQSRLDDAIELARGFSMNDPAKVKALLDVGRKHRWVGEATTKLAQEIEWQQSLRLQEYKDQP